MGSDTIVNTIGIVLVSPCSAAGGPPQFLEAIFESRQEGLCNGIAFGIPHQYANAQSALAPLCRRAKRPRRRTAEQRDELPPPHSITSSARSRNDSGIVRPRALAVFRLITSSYLV